MSKPEKSNDASLTQSANRRVDAAHGPPSHDVPHASEPSLELLHAIAGNATESSDQQTREQALELANILREKQKLLDQRESELNARTAHFENELRARPARTSMTPLDAGIDLSEIDLSDDDSRPVERPIGEIVQRGADPSAQAEQATRHDDRVSADHLAQSWDESRATRADSQSPFAETPPPNDVQPLSESGPQVSSLSAAEVAHHASAVEHGRAPDPHGSGSSKTAAERSVHQEREELARQRQDLDQRQAELAKRKQHVEKMHEQVTELHRESLELQLSTQQLWSELMEEFPSKDLADRMNETRHRMRDHYRLANEMLAERTEELHRMRLDLNRQETRLRQQRRELQMWADRRYDEIESRTANLIQRERELDRLESEFNRQSLQWQEQREAYRNEIGRLACELRSQTA